MILKRIIPCLLIQEDDLVKTIKFSDPFYVGDPINAVKIFTEKEADEIIILDIEASKKKKINFDLLHDIFGESFVPITYGGGIDNLEDAKKLINMGAEKLCFQNTFFNDKKLIKEMINYFGSQAIVVSIDIKKNLFGNYRIWDYINNNFRKKTEFIKTIKSAQDLGVGEIILTDVSREGTFKGIDQNLVKKTFSLLKIPIIYNGGTKSMNDINKIFKSGAQALAVGSFFVFYGKHKAVLISYPSDEIKDLLNE